MLRLQERLVICLLILGTGITSSAQDFIILLPHNMQIVPAEEETIIMWSGRVKKLDYYISINDMFDDTIKTFVTRDTFFIARPDLAPKENNIVLKIETGKGARSEQVVISRKHAEPIDSVTDVVSCKNKILIYLEQRRHAAAFSTFYRYKDTYDINEFHTVFADFNRWLIAGLTARIKVKNGKAFAIQAGATGAVHRAK